MNTIIGHDTIIRLLEQAQKAGMFGHAYCFIGPEHVGKERVARHLAGVLLGTSSDRVGASPDALIVERLQDEKTGKTKKDISIDQMKDVALFMARSALKAHGHKIVIIPEANRMSTSASNALLKTLEEPSPNSHLFLLTTDEALLLPTIRSRCHMIRFAPVDPMLIAQQIKIEGAEEDKAEDIARLSRGLPGLAISWYHTSDEFARYKEEVHRFMQLFGKTFHDKLSSVDSLFGDKTDAIQAREEIKNVLRTWRLLLRDILMHQEKEDDRSIHEIEGVPRVSRSQVLDIDNSIVSAERLIAKNIHPRLLIEQILLRIP